LAWGVQHRPFWVNELDLAWSGALGMVAVLAPVMLIRGLAGPPSGAEARSAFRRAINS
jgi:hypothetical protein